MAFDSGQFLLFLAATLGIHWVLPKQYRSHFQALASLVFIGLFHWWFAVVLLAISAAVYWIGLIIAESETKNVRLVYISVFTLSVILAGYKLIPYFFQNTSDQTFWWLLPIGISYYIFQSIGYLLDIMWGRVKPETNFVDFFLLLGFFAKIPAGPVERSHHFLPQLKSERTFDIDLFKAGLYQFTWGLFKKMVIADRLAPELADFQQNFQDFSGLNLVLHIALLSIQVYADFSGYTDMALGTARLFGLKLMDNFDQPFFAPSVGQFWRRWHITLSTWVLDYVYTPLSLRAAVFGRIGVFASLFVSFAIIGLWHGIEPRFLYFGLMHGTVIIIESSTQVQRGKIGALFPWLFTRLGTLFTVSLFVMTTIWFFAHTPLEFLETIQACFQFSSKGPFDHLGFIDLAISVILALMLIPIDHGLFRGKFHEWAKEKNAFSVLLAITVMLIGIVLFSGVENIPFLYQRF